MVKAGDVVKVRVLEVDVARKRIALSMRKDGGGRDAAEAAEKERRPAACRRAKPEPTGSGDGELRSGAARRDEAAVGLSEASAKRS